MRRADRITLSRGFYPLYIAVAVLSAGCASEPAPTAAGPLSAEDRAAIQAAWDRLAEADTNLDWDVSETLIADDIVHIDPRHAGPIAGRTAWREWIDSMAFETIEGSETRYDVVEIAGSGDLAYVVWTLTGSWVERGETVTTSGKGLTLYERQADGSWLVARNAWNQDPG